MRKYKTGSKWAFWRWSEADSGYIKRLHLIMTPWFAICLHFIRHPDVEPYLHDHPVSFFSLVLKGWYREQRLKVVRADRGSRVVGHHHCSGVRRWFNSLRASLDDRHRITDVSPGGCVTLAFMTRVKRQWGFHTPDGWVYWKDYYSKPVSIGEGLFFVTRKDFYKACREGRVRFEHEVLPPTHWNDLKPN